MIGSRVGTIEVQGSLAQGGMGEVFAGWDKRLERKVALKAVRRDRLGEEARARLLREARILSSLDDPRICRLYDYVEGAHNDWLVMELLDGRPLSQVELEALPKSRRLELAQQLAEVLIETHNKGIVHRDLKPDNLMLMPDGSLKVLDFGVARFDELLADDTAEARAFSADYSASGIETQFGQLLGTLLYMSPEQARGERVGEAADLYAFGLLLRQLLSGQPPFPPDTAPPLLLTRIGRGERPDPSAGGRIDGAMLRLVDELTGADPERRPRAAVAARRIARQRAEPKRRRRRLAISTAIIAVLLGGLALALDLRRSMQRALAAKVEAETARDEAAELADFLVGLFAQPAAAPAGPLTTRALLEKGAAELDRELGDRPRLRSAVALVLGEVYESLGEYQRSFELLQQSLDLRRQEPGRALDLAATLQALGTAHRIGGRYDDAASSFKEALELRLAAFGDRHPDVAETLNGLAIVRRRQGRFDDAEALYLRSLAIRRQTLGAEHPDVAKSLNNLGLLYYYQGRLEASEKMYRRTLEIKEKTLEPNHPSLAQSLNNLANLLTDLGRFDEAEALYRRNLEIWQEVAGARHPATASALENLGYLYEETHRYELAETFLRRALDIRAEAFGRDHPAYASDLSGLGYLYVLWRRLAEARQRLDEALAVQRRTLEAGHPDLGLTLARVAALELGEQKPAAARGKAERALEIFRSAFGPNDPGVGFALYLLALCELADDEQSAALRRLDRADAVYEALPAVAGLQAQAGKIASLRRMVESTPVFDPELVSRIVAEGEPHD